MTREDARKIESILKEQLDVIKPGYTLEITGGFRRCVNALIGKGCFSVDKLNKTSKTKNNLVKTVDARA